MLVLIRFLLQRISEQVSVITAVDEYPFGFKQMFEKGRLTGIIAELPGCDEEPQRANVCICHGVQRRIHAALNPSDRVPTVPFFSKAASWAVGLDIECIVHGDLRFGLRG